MATQKDIADKVGVSVSLVSRALAGKAGDIGITAETVQRVRDAAEQLGYVPNAAACVLKGASSLTIGVVVFDFEDPFFGSIIGNLQRLARREMFALVLVGFERRQIRLADLDPLIRQQLDGLIVVGGESVATWVDRFLQKNIPVVRIGTGLEADAFHRVGVDNEAGVRLLLRHLRSLGHQTVGAVAAPIAPHQLRFSRFAALAGEEGLDCRPAWCFTAGSSVYDAGEAAGHLVLEMMSADVPTALAASSDLVAVGLMNVLMQDGVRVPEDLSVVGFDDIPYARLSNPPLTTVRQPLEALTARAFDLVQQGHHTSPDTVTEFFTPELIPRKSTARPPRKG